MKLFKASTVISIILLNVQVIGNVWAVNDYALGCKLEDIVPSWHVGSKFFINGIVPETYQGGGSEFIGQELDDFRLEVSDYLEKYDCEKRDYPAYCDENDFWKIDNHTSLIRTWCSSGARINNTIWFLQKDEVLVPLILKEPIIEIIYHNNDIWDENISSVNQIGFSTSENIFSDTEFDPDTNTITSFYRDGSSHQYTKWEFINQQPLLKSFTEMYVGPSADNKIRVHILYHD